MSKTAEKDPESILGLEDSVYQDLPQMLEEVNGNNLLEGESVVDAGNLERFIEPFHSLNSAEGDILIGDGSDVYRLEFQELEQENETSWEYCLVEVENYGVLSPDNYAEEYNEGGFKQVVGYLDRVEMVQRESDGEIYPVLK